MGDPGCGCHVIAAAFQDKLWRPNLEPLIDLGAKIRIVQCHTDPATARHRLDGRGPRSAHADGTVKDDEYYASFQRVDLVVPSLDVDTTSGYQPSLDEVVRFVNS